MVLSTVEITTRAHLDTTFIEMEAIYNDPASAAICPLFAPLPHPEKQEMIHHLKGTKVKIVETRNDDDLQIVILVEDGVIRTCWGLGDPAAQFAAHLDPGGTAEWFESEGMDWVLDTELKGWVTREYFSRYANVSGSPFELGVTHPGMAPGQTYADLDDVQWTLTINRPTISDPWAWIVSLK